MATGDLLTALLELVQTAAREGTKQALESAHERPSPRPMPLVDKRELALSLGVSAATIDRLCRQGRIPFILVGEVRRFDFDAVRAALETKPEPADAPANPASQSAPRDRLGANVRMLSRGTRQ